MNGKGNGNKDEVVFKVQIVCWLNYAFHQFLYMALGTISTGGKDPAGRPMGSVIASTRGDT